MIEVPIINSCTYIKIINGFFIDAICFYEAYTPWCLFSSNYLVYNFCEKPLSTIYLRIPILNYESLTLILLLGS